MFRYLFRMTQSGYNGMHIAAFYGMIEIVRILDKNGLSAMQKSKNGLNALHLASQSYMQKWYFFLFVFSFLDLFKYNY